MASAFRLEEPRRGGRLKLKLEQEVRSYVEQSKEYAADLVTWRRFGGLQKRPVAPSPPQWLALWFELQRWEGHLLVAGGLLDQPEWAWDMVDLAGRLYDAILDENQRKLDTLTGEQDAK